MNRLISFFFGGLLVALISAPYAHAELVDPEKHASATLPTPDVCRAPNNPVTASTASALHGQFLSLWSIACSDGIVRSVTSDISAYNEISGGYFRVNYTVQGTAYQSTPIPVSIIYTCPTGFTLNNDYKCFRADTCKPGTKLDSGMYTDTDGNGITPRACIGGCWGNFKGTGPQSIYNFGGNTFTDVYIGDYVAEGSTCTVPTPTETELPTDPEDPDPLETPEYDCASQGMSYGEYNGQIVCVPAGTPDAPPVNTPDKSSQTNPDGTRTETDNRDSVDGDSVTRESTTTTYDANGNVTGQTTTTITASTGAFCEQNPEAEVCKKSKVTGGGTCETPPVSTGDAIQAAIALQAWHTRCEVQKQNDRVTEAKEWADEVFSEDIQNPLDNKQTVSIGMFDTTSLIPTASCPAPRTFSFMGFSFSLGFDQFCWLGAIVGHIIVIAAGMFSLRNVIGAL